MKRSILLWGVMLMASLSLVGCGGGGETGGGEASPSPAAGEASPAEGSPAASPAESPAASPSP